MGQLQTVHGDAQLLRVHFDEQVAAVDFRAVERIARCRFDGIGLRRSPAAYEASDFRQIITLIVVNVAGASIRAMRTGGLAASVSLASREKASHEAKWRF